MAANQSVSRLQRILAQLPPQIKQPIRAAVFDQAHELRRTMLFHAPKGKTFTLRDSIRVEEGRRELRAIVRAGGPSTTVGGYDYALAQEFGTQKTPAQPFFWVSYRSKKLALRRAIKAAAKTAIQARWHD